MKIQFETSQQEYIYYNDLLKDDLIKFLNLTQCFIEPIVISFYNIQCKVFGALYGRIYEVIQHNPTLLNDSKLNYHFIEEIIENLIKESKSMNRKGIFSQLYYIK